MTTAILKNISNRNISCQKKHANTRIIIIMNMEAATYIRFKLEIILNEYYIKTIIADLS